MIVTRRIIRATALGAALGLVGLGRGLNAQSGVEVQTLTPLKISTEALAQSPSVRGLPGGKVLVHDPGNKRLILFHSTLATFVNVIDSVGGSGYKYPFTGYRFSQLIPFSGDSTLFTDFAANAYVVVDASGKIARMLSHPKTTDLVSVSNSIPNSGFSGADRSGRLVYRGFYVAPPRPAAGQAPTARKTDSIPIVRADFEKRSVDTLAWYTVPSPPQPVPQMDANGKRSATMYVNPFRVGPDDWAITSDGTVAILRGHDYHVDFVTESGTKFSGPKIPFQWKRLTDSEKQGRIDSLRHVVDSMATTSRPYGWRYTSYGAPGGGYIVDTIIPKVIYPELSDIADYFPATRAGSFKPDADGNVWILPTTSNDRSQGLVYDQVDQHGALIRRVKLPADRVVAGFAPNGVVYLAHFNRTNRTWNLERSQLARN